MIRGKVICNGNEMMTVFAETPKEGESVDVVFEDVCGLAEVQKVAHGFASAQDKALNRTYKVPCVLVYVE